MKTKWIPALILAMLLPSVAACARYSGYHYYPPHAPFRTDRSGQGRSAPARTSARPYPNRRSLDSADPANGPLLCRGAPSR